MWSWKDLRPVQASALGFKAVIEFDRNTGETGGTLQGLGKLSEKFFVSKSCAGCGTFDGFGRDGWGVDIVGACEEIEEGHENLQVVP
jgi:hypothetical protein